MRHTFTLVPWWNAEIDARSSGLTRRRITGLYVPTVGAQWLVSWAQATVAMYDIWNARPIVEAGLGITRLPVSYMAIAADPRLNTPAPCCSTRTVAWTAVLARVRVTRDGRISAASTGVPRCTQTLVGSHVRLTGTSILAWVRGTYPWIVVRFEALRGLAWHTEVWSFGVLAVSVTGTRIQRCKVTFIDICEQKHKSLLTEQFIVCVCNLAS